MGEHRRRIDKVLDPEFLVDLPEWPLEELRRRQAECLEIETEVSYVRRMTQARIDILEAELDRRASGGSVGDLIAALPEILADERPRAPAKKSRLTRRQRPAIGQKFADVSRVAALEFHASSVVPDAPDLLHLVRAERYLGQRREFVDTVREILLETRFEPGLLELEITESIAMRDEEQTISTLRRLHDLGEFIRDQRRTARLSLRKLSELAGISNPYLSQIERGLRKPSAEILQAIARALRISSETLYVRAGILEERDTEADLVGDILRDRTITEGQKQALVEIYRSFQREQTEEDGTPHADSG